MAEPETWEEHWAKTCTLKRSAYAASEATKVTDPEPLQEAHIAPPLTMETVNEIITELGACGYGFNTDFEYHHDNESDSDDSEDDDDDLQDDDDDDDDDDDLGGGTSKKKGKKRKASRELTSSQKRRSLRALEPM